MRLKSRAVTVLTAFLAFILSGCANDYLAAGLPLLEGKPLSQAVHYLGDPTEEKKLNGKTMYSWINDPGSAFYAPDIAPHPIIIQNQGRPVVAFSEAGSSSYQTGFHERHCRLDIVADRGIVTHTQYRGTGGGCWIFSDQLKPLVTAAALEAK